MNSMLPILFVHKYILLDLNQETAVNTFKMICFLHGSIIVCQKTLVYTSHMDYFKDEGVLCELVFNKSEYHLR